MSDEPSPAKIEDILSAVERDLRSRLAAAGERKQSVDGFGDGIFQIAQIAAMRETTNVVVAIRKALALPNREPDGSSKNLSTEKGMVE